MPYAPTMEKFFMVNPDKVEKAMRELAEFDHTCLRDRQH
jgi:2-oxoisovalerate dehydrogenase E1 component beta subunit